METMVHVGVFAESGDIFNCNRRSHYGLLTACMHIDVPEVFHVWLSKTCSVPWLRWPKMWKIKPWLFIADKSACVFVSKMLIQRDYCTGAPQAKVSARLNVLLLFWDLSAIILLNVPLFSNNASHSQRIHLQATLSDQLTQKWIFALWKVKRPEGSAVSKVLAVN